MMAEQAGITPPILKHLSAAHWVTGKQIGDALGVGRAAVWKQVAHLRQSGIEVEARAGLGYRLAQEGSWLDSDAIQHQLNLSGVAADVDVVWQTDSTNRQLWQREKAERLSVLLAEHQTAGRGRRGRAWVSPAGAGLWLSARAQLPGGLQGLSGLALAASVMVATTLRAKWQTEAVIKWPNDLYYQNAKLGGLLVEVRGESNGPCQAVIGVGLNCQLPEAARRSIEQPAIGLQQICGCTIDRNALAADLVRGLALGLDRFSGRGLAGFIDQWQALDMLHGHAVRVSREGASEPLQGWARGIDQWGRLEVTDSHGQSHYLSDGEVSVRPIQ